MARNRAAFVRAALGGLVLVALVGVAHSLPPAQSLARMLLLAAAGAAGISAIRSLADGLFGTVTDQRVLLWRNLTSWSLYVLLVVLVASEAGVNVSGLLLGGAILGVVAASASQAPLGNFFAGLILLVGRPFAIGETIRLRTSIAGGIEYEGTVVDARAFYTTLITAEGELLRLPNTAVISSVVVVGGAPLQAEVDVEVRARTDLAELKRRIEQPFESGAVAEVRPRNVSGGRVTCTVRVRARRAIGGPELAAAVVEAVAAQERAA